MRAENSRASCMVQCRIGTASANEFGIAQCGLGDCRVVTLAQQHTHIQMYLRTSGYRMYYIQIK